MTKLNPNNLADKVKRKSLYKKDSEKNSHQILLGFKSFGIIGWSVVVPTLVGALLGMWLDRHYPEPRSWTLMLLVAGIVLGCSGAWFWIDKQNKEIHEERNKKEGENK